MSALCQFRTKCVAAKNVAIRCRYSITSSAAANMEDGTERPSALAVLRLMINSNLVGACSGAYYEIGKHYQAALERAGHTKSKQQAARKIWRCRIGRRRASVITNIGAGVAVTSTLARRRRQIVVAKISELRLKIVSWAVGNLHLEDQ